MLNYIKRYLFFYIMSLFCLLQGVFKNQLVFDYHLLRWVNRCVTESSKLRRSRHQSKVIITNNVLIPKHPIKNGNVKL